MRLGGVEGGHQLSKLLLVEGRHRLAAALLLLSPARLFVVAGLTRVILEDLYGESATHRAIKLPAGKGS